MSLNFVNLFLNVLSTGWDRNTDLKWPPCVTEHSSSIISGGWQLIFGSEYVHGQRNTSQHYRAISKPLVNDEECNHNVSQEEEFATILKFSLLARIKFPRNSGKKTQQNLAIQKKTKTFETNSAFLTCEEILFLS